MKINKLALSYRRALLTTTALVGISFAATPALADNITPTAGADTTRSTSASTTGYTVQTGNDDSVNTGNTTAFIMDGTGAQQNLTINTPVVVTAGTADTVSITAGNSPTITIDSGATLTNTGVNADTIHAGAINVGTATINVNGTLSDSGGGTGQAIDFASVTGGTTNITLNTTTGSISGDINLGLGTSNINITGNGTNGLTGAVTGIGGNDNFNITLGAAGNTFATGGAINLGTGTDVINVNRGIFSVGHNVTAGSTVLGTTGGATLALTAGTYNAGNITSAATANAETITVANGATLSNNVDLSAGSGAHILNVATGGTFAGTYTGGSGTDDVTLGNADLAGAIDGGLGADSATFTAGAHTNAITNTESLILSGTATYANGAAITGLDTALTIGAGTTLTANNNISGSATTLSLNGTANVGVNNVIALGTGTMSGSTGTYGVNINSTQASSITLNNAGAQNLSGLTVSVTHDPSQFVKNGTTYTIVNNSGAGALTVPTAAVVDDLYILNFTATAGGTGGNDLILTALRVNAYNTTATNNQNRAVGAALESYGAAGGTNSELNAVLLQLDSMSSAAQINHALETMTPAINGIAEASMDTQNASINNITSHLDAFRDRSEGNRRGVNSGDMFGYVKGAWLQGFGNFGEQGTRDGIAGYKSATYGGSLGFDTEKLMDGALTGLSLGYANTDVDSKSLNNADTKINSYQVAAYTTKTLSPRYESVYVDGLAAFAYNDYDGSRNVVVGTFNRAIDDNYQGYQGTARVAVGKDYNLGGIGLLFTPEASAQYTYLHLNSYTESGANGVNLHVGEDDSNALFLGLGGKLAYSANVRGVDLIPEVRAKVTYDPIGDEIQTTDNFTGGGPAFTTKGADVAQMSYSLGAGVKVLNLAQDVQLTADYDANFREDYVAHNVQARLRVGF